MKKYIVTIVLITGYHWNKQLEEYDTDSPKLKEAEFEVMAHNEDEAISKAKEMETSGYGIWESYCTENDRDYTTDLKQDEED